jgi:ubiquinone/menaquinone biosynthesis C-methylase UbiE
MIKTLKKLVRKVIGPTQGIPYWEKRAKLYGARSVLNISHTPEEFEAVTEMQVREIFPYLRQQLNGSEKVILDYGCGPGRFTAKLADVIGGEAIGVDPIKTLINLAPKADNVRYKISREGKIPMPDSSVDAVWICLVLGGLLPKVLEPTCREIDRVLKPGGLLFVVECTTEGKVDTPERKWKFRSSEQYAGMFASFASLKHLHDYHDIDERVSLLAGRKEASALRSAQAH